MDGDTWFFIVMDNNRVHFWQHQGKRINPAYVVDKPITPNIILLEAIEFYLRTPLVVIQGPRQHSPTPMGSYIRMPCHSRDSTLVVFQQDNTCPHSSCVSKDCPRYAKVFFWSPGSDMYGISLNLNSDPVPSLKDQL